MRGRAELKIQRSLVDGDIEAAQQGWRPGHTVVVQICYKA